MPSDFPLPTPFLTVVMPIHDGAEWIGATLDSLVAEPGAGLDIIVVDSSPTCDTAEIVERYAGRLPIRLLRRPDLSPWQTKTNLGVTLAAADHVCILHQDDLWLPGRVDTLRRWIAEAPQAALHLAPTAIVDRHGRHMGNWNCPLPSGRLLDADFLLERLVVQNFVSVPAPVFRKDAWLAAGGMDDRLWYTADWDIWAKLAATGATIYHDQVTTAFRIHGGSLTMTGSRSAEEFRWQMRTVLDRHLARLPAGSRSRVESVARTSITVNVLLASASTGQLGAVLNAIRKLLVLGPGGTWRYLRDSRLHERVLPRLRARFAGAF
jgi:glycosyltransferase involved in cell wall biosynthesis